MMYLDTHVVAWLFAGLRDRFPGRAQERLEAEDLAISPIVKLELQYLFEVGRVTEGAETVIGSSIPARPIGKFRLQFG